MAGLIVTCARHFEPDACDEIEKILADLGDESAYGNFYVWNNNRRDLA